MAIESGSRGRAAATSGAPVGLRWLMATALSAARPGLGASTVRDFEVDRRSPLPESPTAMHAALDTAGVEFLTAGEAPAAGGAG